MATIDIVLLFVLLAFFLLGFVRGFVREIGSFIGFFLSLWVASHYYEQAATFVLPYTKAWPIVSQPISVIVGFFGLFVVTKFLFGLAVKIIDFMIRRMSPVPFLNIANRFGGAALGLIEGVMFIGTVLFFLLHIPFMKDLQESAHKSKITSAVVSASQFITPLLPDPSVLTSSLFDPKAFDAETGKLLKELQRRYGDLQNVDLSKIDLKQYGVDSENLPPEIQNFIKSQKKQN